MEASGASWEMYAHFDQDLAKNMTTDEDWEAALLEKARAGTSDDGTQSMMKTRRKKRKK